MYPSSNYSSSSQQNSSNQSSMLNRNPRVLDFSMNGSANSSSPPLPMSDFVMSDYARQSGDAQFVRLRARPPLPDPLLPQIVDKIRQVRTWAKAVRQFPEGPERNKEMNRILDYCASSEPMIIPQLRLCVSGIWTHDCLQPVNVQELMSGLYRMPADQWPKALRRSGWDKRLQDPEILKAVVHQLTTELPDPNVYLRYLRDLVRSLRPNEAFVRTMIEATRHLPEPVRAQLCEALITAGKERMTPTMETTLIDMICRQSGSLTQPCWKDVLSSLINFGAMNAPEAQIALLTAMMNLEKSSAIFLLERLKPKFDLLKRLPGTLENEYACLQAVRLMSMALNLSVQHEKPLLAGEIFASARQIASRLGQPWSVQLLKDVVADFLAYFTHDANKLRSVLPMVLQSVSSLDLDQKFGVLSALSDFLTQVHSNALPAQQWDELFRTLAEICTEFKDSELAVPLMVKLTQSWQRLPSVDPDSRYSTYLALLGEICPVDDQLALLSRFGSDVDIADLRF